MNEFFLAICRGLRMTPTNVSTASSLTPPSVAKKKIEAAQALVAVCTRRDELASGGYHMPQAVHDEISLAFGTDTPALMIVEEGVVLAGFKSNFGTYLQFKRDDLHDPAFLEKAVEAMYGLRLEVVGAGGTAPWQGMAEAHAEYIHYQAELRFEGATPLWRYATTKRLVFSKPFRTAIPFGVWAGLSSDLPADAQDIEFEIKLDDSSRGIKLDTAIIKKSPTCIEASIRLRPPPIEGDFVEYSTVSASPYLNPTWLEEVPSQDPIHLNSGDYKCADGLIILHRTRRAVVEFRFAKGAGLGRSDLIPFVASHTSMIDFEVESELARVDLTVEPFGSSIVVRMEIESPLPGHMYGVAWNPKPRPD